MTIRKWLRLLVVPAFLAVSCSGNSNTPVTPTPSPTPTPTPTPIPSAPSQIVYLAGAGDIADCTSVGSDGGANGEATAKLLDRRPDASVFTLGDKIGRAHV